MLAIEFTYEERSMLGGWLSRELGFQRAIKALLSQVITPKVTDTTTAISQDLDFISRVKSSIRVDVVAQDGKKTILSEEDADLLLLIAQANTYDNRRQFWSDVERKIQEAQLGAEGG